MIHRIKTIITVLILISVSLTVYYILKSDNLKQGYIERIDNSAGEFAPYIDKISKTAPEGTTGIFENLINRDKSIALIATVDSSGRIKTSAKNNSIITSASIYDSLIEDITAGKFDSTKTEIKTYTTPGGQKKEFFVKSFSADNNRTVIAHIYKPDKKTIVRLSLEIVLIIIFCIIASAMLLMALAKKGIIKDDREIKEKIINLASSKEGADDSLNQNQEASPSADEQEPMPIDESELSRIFSADEKQATRGAAVNENKYAWESLNSRIFELFKKIHKDISPESISLYIKKTKDTMNKTYELKGKAFLKIDSTVIDRIEMKEFAHLNKSGAHISGNGTVVTIPLIDDNSLIGLIKIKLKEASDKINLEIMQTELKETVREIKEFLVINNVITDRSTGFYSTAYFNIKLNEEISRAIKSGTSLSLIIADIFKNVVISDEQKKTVLKIIQPGIREAAGNRCELFLIKDMIAAIMPGVSAEEADETKKALYSSMSRYRIKLSEDEIIKLKASAVLVTSTGADDVTNIYEKAINLLSAG